MKNHKASMMLAISILAVSFLLLGAGAVVGAGLQDLGGVTSAMKPDISGMVMDKLGVKTPDASGLMEKDKAVTGEVTDPSKLASYGMESKAGDKVEMTNMGGGEMGVKNLTGGSDMLNLDMKDVFGEGAKFLMK